MGKKAKQAGNNLPDVTEQKPVEEQTQEPVTARREGGQTAENQESGIDEETREGDQTEDQESGAGTEGEASPDVSEPASLPEPIPAPEPEKKPIVLISNPQRKEQTIIGLQGVKLVFNAEGIAETDAQQADYFAKVPGYTIGAGSLSTP